MIADKWSKNLDRAERMNADALAPNLIRQCAGTRGYDEPIKVLLERAYEALRRKSERWTRRRVKAMWHGEARRIEFDEIVEMAEVAELQKARREHAEFIRETARVAALRVAVEAAAMGEARP